MSETIYRTEEIPVPSPELGYYYRQQRPSITIYSMREVGCFLQRFAVRGPDSKNPDPYRRMLNPPPHIVIAPEKVSVELLPAIWRLICMPVVCTPEDEEFCDVLDLTRGYYGYILNDLGVKSLQRFKNTTSICTVGYGEVTYTKNRFHLTRWGFSHGGETGLENRDFPDFNDPELFAGILEFLEISRQ